MIDSINIFFANSACAFVLDRVVPFPILDALCHLFLVLLQFEVELMHFITECLSLVTLELPGSSSKLRGNLRNFLRMSLLELNELIVYFIFDSVGVQRLIRRSSFDSVVQVREETVLFNFLSILVDFINLGHVFGELLLVFLVLEYLFLQDGGDVELEFNRIQVEVFVVGEQEMQVGSIETLPVILLLLLIFKLVTKFDHVDQQHEEDIDAAVLLED